MPRERSSNDSESEAKGDNQGAKAKIKPEDRMAALAHGKLKELSKKWFTHIFLLMAIVIYTIIGAILFSIIEGGPEAAQRNQLLGERNQLIGQLQEIISTGSPNVMDKAMNLIQEYEGQLVEHFEKNSKLLVRGDNELNWSILGSAFFCGTVYTTIGYGHIAPVTSAGRILTIIYSLIGIPLFLTLLADFGKILTKGIKFIWLYVRRCYYTCSFKKPTGRVVKRRGDDEIEDLELGGSTDDPHIGDEFNLPILVALIIFMIYMLIGACLFFLSEDWTFFEAFYFIFVSLSTIGFGDFVPVSQVYMLAMNFYVVFGLALTSMCINVVGEKITETFARAGMRPVEMIFSSDDDSEDEEDEPKEKQSKTTDETTSSTVSNAPESPAKGGGASAKGEPTKGSPPKGGPTK